MRRHSVCVHNPPCCYITDGGTDSSLTECCYPQCRSHQKLKKPHGVNVSRYNKRKDPALLPKLCYAPRIPGLKTNKTRNHPGSCENRYDGKRSKHKGGRNLEEASSIGSVSSRCTSLSVDVSYEMAAVNKDIEALLARYEKAFDDKPVDVFEPRVKVIEKGRNHKYKKENLSPEQIKLLSMDKPPLEKLKELPYECLEALKPRPPPSHWLKEKAPTTNIGVKKDLKESYEAFIQKEQAGEKNKSELLESLWKDVVGRGLAKDELKKNIKPIYTSMTLDENASININFGEPPSNLETQQKKGTSVGTAISPRMKTNPSVATQTSGEYDSFLHRLKSSSATYAGPIKKVEDQRKRSSSDCSPDIKNWMGMIDDLDIGDSDKRSKKKPTSSIPPPPTTAKPSGDASTTNPKEMLTNLIENRIENRIKQKMPTLFTTAQQREMNVYTCDVPSVFKKAEWFKSRTSHYSNADALSKKQPEINISEKVSSLFNKSEIFTQIKEPMTQFLNKENSAPDSRENSNEMPLKKESRIENHSGEKSVTSFDEKSKECFESINVSTKVISSITDQEEKIMCSFLQSVNPDLKSMKENCDELDTPLCVEIIKRLTDTMLKCEPGKIADELTNRNCYLYLEELRKLRAQHLRHIQNEVRHIEELDKFLDNIGIAAQVLYSAAKVETCKTKKTDE